MKSKINNIQSELYFSRFNNLIKLPNTRDFVLYNSLSGAVTVLSDTQYHDIFKKKISSEEVQTFLLDKKYVYPNPEHETRMIEKISKISAQIRRKKLKLHFFVANKGYKCPLWDNLFQAAEEILHKSPEKSITLYIYIYKKPEKGFLLCLNHFFKTNQLSGRVAVIFIINPIEVNPEQILSLKDIKKKSVSAIIDQHFFKEEKNFSVFLKVLYPRIIQYPQNGLPCVIIFNIKNPFLDLIEPFFSFFLKKGELRFNMTYALNPVKEKFQINNKTGLFCEPDYTTYFSLLKVYNRSPKYNLIKILGYGLILKTQQFLFDKKYILPTLDFCERESQRIFLSGSMGWTNCFKSLTCRLKEEELFPLKCRKCSWEYFCSDGCMFNQHRECPPVEEFFHINAEKLYRAQHLFKRG